MHRKRRHQMQLPRPQFKRADVMPDHGPAIEDQPQAGKWTDHIFKIPPATRLGALHREHLQVQGIQEFVIQRASHARKIIQSGGAFRV